MLAIIQARMSSTRFPGKVLYEIEGKPMLWYVMHRVARAKHISMICIAMPAEEKNGEIDDWLCHQKYDEFDKPFCWDFACETNDVLGRYYHCATALGVTNPDTWSDVSDIVRITSDCPLIDPKIIDFTIDHYFEGGYDYVHNCNTYPTGLDTQICSFEVLERINKEAIEPYDREHVLTYIESHPEIFRIGELRYKHNFRDLEWSVDLPKHIEFVMDVVRTLGPDCTMEDILKTYYWELL